MSNEESNRLIAEFMGVPTWTSKSGYLYTDTSKPDLICYDTSWDWLMHVVEKIIQYEFEDGDKAYPRTFGMQIQDDNGEWNYMVRFNRFAVHSNKLFITAAYDAVVEFIEWYNLTSKLETK